MKLFYEPQALELAKWYRELEKEALLEAAHSQGVLRTSYTTIAERWERLATEAEAKAQAEATGQGIEETRES